MAKNSLMFSENLTLPTFQVIVMTANMGCAKCRQKVSHVISKITGLKEYTVDVPKRQVIVKGDFGYPRKIEDYSPKNQKIKSRWHPLQLFKSSCFAWCTTASIE